MRWAGLLSGRWRARRRRRITSKRRSPRTTKRIRSDRRSAPTSACSRTPGTRTRSGCSATRPLPWHTSSRRIALARRLDHMYSQTLALAYAAMLHQMRRDTGACARARGGGRGTVRAVRVRLLRRVGAGADRLGARAGAATGGRSRSSSRRCERLDAQPGAGAPAVLPVVARRDVRPRRQSRSRGLDSGRRHRAWRSSAATCGGCRRCTSRRASSSPPSASDASRGLGWPAHRQPRLEQRILAATGSRCA